MIPVDKQMQLIKRGITNLIDEGELRKKLERGQSPLPSKAGFRPHRAGISIWATLSSSTSSVIFRNWATGSSSSSATSPAASGTPPAVPPPVRL